MAARPSARRQAPDKVIWSRVITVRFDANVSREIAWKFKPVTRTMDLNIGESGLAIYKASNPTSRTLRGTATFNVTPEIVGSYFNKIECFCFTEQELAPGESVDMPVTFFVDPDIVKDPDAGKIREITLSYTFFPVKDGKSAAAASPQSRGS